MRVKYLGVMFPEAQFAKFRGVYAELAKMRTSCQPMSADYNAVSGLIHELDKCATHFTGNEHFFAGNPAPADPRSKC